MALASLASGRALKVSVKSFVYKSSGFAFSSGSFERKKIWPIFRSCVKQNKGLLSTAGLCLLVDRSPRAVTISGNLFRLSRFWEWLLNSVAHVASCCCFVGSAFCCDVCARECGVSNINLHTQIETVCLASLCLSVHISVHKCIRHNPFYSLLGKVMVRMAGRRNVRLFSDTKT